MPSRRSVLKWAAASAAATPLANLITRPAMAATTMPVTIVNDTGLYANSTLWIYVVGTNPAGQQCYLRSDGALVAVSGSLNGPVTDLVLCTSKTRQNN